MHRALRITTTARHASRDSPIYADVAWAIGNTRAHQARGA
jgi:hypothetical protein